MLLSPARHLVTGFIDLGLTLLLFIPLARLLVFRPLSRILSERDRGKEALRESGELFSSFLRHTPIYAFIKEVTPTESRVLLSSDNYRDMIGIPGTEMVGKTMEELFPKEFAEKITADDWAAVSGNKVLSLDEDWNGRNYTTIKFPIRHGSRNLLAGYTIDITERKQVEERLRESEGKFSTVFQTAPYSITIFHWKSGILIEANDAFLSLFGFSRDEAVRDPSLHSKIWFHAGDQEQVAASLREGQVVMGREFLFRRKNGEVFPALYSARLIPMRNEPCILSNITDISAQKKTEEALRKSQILLQSSIEGIKGAYISSIDRNYDYFYFNPAHKKRMKEFYNTDIEIGMNLLDCITVDDDKASTKRNYDRAFSGESLTITKGYHSSIPCFENTFSPIRNDKGEVIGATGFALDITDRIIAERERRKSEEYLLQVQRLESLGVLAGGIAHDFNNILTGVFGFVDLAKSLVNDPLVSDYLSQAIESMERAKGLTRQLLTFAKGGAPVKKPTSVSLLVRETSQFALSGSNVKCSFAIPGDLWPCNVDRNQIGQVVQNLMINAIQAMPMGGVIEVKAANLVLQEREHPTLAKGRYVGFSVADQGTGIPKEMLPRIFDPFFTTKTKGHGLGLAISHSIISRHDGAIRVESEPGKGSVFHVVLPACEDSSVENEKASFAKHVGSGTFLVMDDEEAVRKLLSRVLQSFGYTVLCMENGKETMDFFLEDSRKGASIKAMILDLTIPGGIGGKEIAAEIRRWNKDVPLFVTSGYADDPIMANPKVYGFTASISKPFIMSELVELLERHMGRENGESTNA